MVLTAEISLTDAFFGKTQFNVLGDYGRWDVLSLNFSREKLLPFKNITPDENHSAGLRQELRETNKLLVEMIEKLDLLTNKLDKEDN